MCGPASSLGAFGRTWGSETLNKQRGRASSCSEFAAAFASAVSVLDVFLLFPPWLYKPTAGFYSVFKPGA